jgi:hypothetical protein
MSIAHRFTTAAAALLAAAGSLAAQGSAQGAAQTTGASDQQGSAVAAPVADPAPVAAPAPAQPVSLAPFADNATVGVRSLSPSAPVPYAPPPRDHVGTNVAMMIVGGAGLIVGAIIGGTPGTIVMVAGGVVGLVGLYKYLQ